MIVGSGRHGYEWVDNWARIPDTPSGRENGRTHGVAASATGRVIVFHQADPAVLVFERDGTLADSWGDRFGGAHGLAIAREDGEEFLWVTDEFSGEVSQLAMDGTTLRSLDPPDLPVYSEKKFSPTSVAAWDEDRGGNGDVWVADGYGASYLHRYDYAGDYVGSLTGEEGAGRFNCPHGIWIDTRKDNHELYVADRGNRRVQVFDIEGRFLRVIGEETLHSPCGFAANGRWMVVPQLMARVDILDGNDKLVCSLGDNREACEVVGWPNHSADRIEAGKFNSPHAAAVDDDGDIYVVEWIIGGRITKLAKK
jgi:hypothetical protein